jgi:RNA polymerase sigma factor (sigma-70 family)
MLDPVLRDFVEAADPAEADERLAALLEERAVPLVRRIATHKLKSFARDDAAEVEDLTAEALLALVSKLQSLRADPAAHPIASFDDYAAAVVFHAFAHHLRLRHPERSRLKNRLRYALTRDRRLGLWPTPAGMACGLAAWRPGPPSAEAGARLDALGADAERLSRWTARAGGSEKNAGSVLREVLLALGGPVEFDHLVGTMAVRAGPAAAARGPDARTASVADPSEPADVALDRRRAMERLWREIGALPVRQRVALLLGLRDGHGAGLLWVFPVVGVAGIPQIARALEMADGELAELWGRLPLADLEIAERLGCTRQQVINLRAAGRKRLSNRVEEPALPGASREGANMRPVSVSSKDEA